MILRPPSERGGSNSNKINVFDWVMILKFIGSEGFSAAVPTDEVEKGPFPSRLTA